MQVTPPAGGGAPPQAAQQGPGQAEQAIDMIKKGFELLGKMMQAAGQNLPPDDVKLFQMAVQATDNFIQAITSGEGQDADQGQPPPSKAPGGPMPQGANAGAKSAM